MIIRDFYIMGIFVSALFLMVGSGGLLLIFRGNKRRIPAAERAEIARKKAERQDEHDLFKAITKEAKYLAKAIPEHMAIQNQMTWNFHEVRRDGKKKKKKSLVRFSVILLTRTEIWFKIDGRKLPYGTSFSDIKDPAHNVKDNLQHAIHRPVQFFEDHEFNFFIRVGLKNSIMGIPKKVSWQKALAALPKGNPFAVAIGVNDNNKVIYQDLRRWPHGIVAGATEQGKSVQMTQWLLTLMMRNSPKSCKFVLVDLKDGLEFSRFKEMPHVLKFVDEPEDVLPELYWLRDEYKRRTQLFKGCCQNIAGWNTQNPNRRLPYIFLFIDEMADLMLNRKLATKADEVLSDLARKARAAGIHMVVATQILEKKVLSLQIRGNFPGRCVFSVPGITESVMVINNSLAANLGHPGRCVYRAGATTHILQAPIASDDDFDSVLIADEKEMVAARPFDEIDLFRVALENHGGQASIKPLFADVQGQMSKSKITKTLKAFEFDFTENTVLEIDGGRYVLSHPRRTKAGTQSRKLIAVNGRLPKNENELASWSKAGTRNQEPNNINPTPTPIEEAAHT